MNAGGDGRQCLVSRDQIDISTNLIGVGVIEIADYQKATNKELASTTVVRDGVRVAQIDKEAGNLVRFL